MKCCLIVAARLAVLGLFLIPRSGQAQGTPTVPTDVELRQPARLVPGESGALPTPLPQPVAPDGLSLPAWLMPGEPAMLDGPTIDSQVQLATADFPVPRRSAAHYAQAVKLVAGATTHGDLSNILRLCEAGLAGEPSDELKLELGRLAAWAANCRGELLIEEGDERAAFDDFTRAIVLDGSCGAAFHNRAITYATYGQREEALRDFAKAIELNPEAIEPYRNRAELNFQLGRLADAEADFSAAIVRAPHEGLLRSRRGEVYHRQGKAEPATQEFNAALELGCESGGALAHRASLAAIGGDFDQAIVDFDRALRDDPYRAATYQGVAWLLATCPDARYRDAKKALEAARRAERFGMAGDPVVLDTLAVAHANAGDYAAAIQHAQQAAQLAPQPLRGEIEGRMVMYRQGQPYRGE